MTRPAAHKSVFLFTLALACAVPSFAGLTYTCDSTVTARNSGACDYLNNTIAPLYTNTFNLSNVNLAVYVQLGNTGLGQSSYYFDIITYQSYLAALTTMVQASGNTIQTSAVNALNNVDAGLYSSWQVFLTGALAAILGQSNPPGSSSSGQFCSSPGIGPCYHGIVTVTNDPNTDLFFRNGTEPADAFDFYSTVEHETDEILGTGSCIDTGGPKLSNVCGSNALAAVDLFRYQSAGNLVLISTTPGAYFSYNGGQTNGADGNVYNTVDNGLDYADFVSTCSGQQSVQDAEACSGHDGGLDITNDGGAEINILNAIGFPLSAQSTPKPTIRTNGVVPVYSTSTTVQPGEWISIYGSNLGPTPAAQWTGNFPTQLGGTSVTIDGIPAYLWYVGSGQINLQVPNDANINRSVPVVVTVGAQSADSIVNLAAVAPSFSLLDSSHVAGIIVHSDGTYDIIGPTGSSLGYPTVAAKAGDNIQLYGVGFGPTTPPVSAGQLLPAGVTPQTTNMVTLSIHGQNVLTGLAYLSEAGLYQINLTVPPNLGTGDVPLSATVAGVQTQAGVVISLQ